MNKPLFVKKIWQKDKQHFAIEWNDGIISTFRLSTLQRHCPCAGCKEPSSPSCDLKKANENVQAVVIKNVGRYALRVQFTEGCSNGIFDFAMLRNLVND